MPSVITFNPDSPTVPNRVTGYKRSVQESDWAGVPNSILYYDPSGDPPEVSLLIANLVPISEWKVEGGIVVALTQADKDALAAQQAIDAAAAAVANLAALKVAVKAQLVNQHELRDAILAVVDVMVPEINLLRAQHGLAARTAGQVATALKNAYDARVDSWT